MPIPLPEGLSAEQFAAGFAMPPHTNPLPKGADTKTFVGDGTQILRTPGLKRVDRVFVGSMELPLRHVIRQPNTALTEFVDITVDLVVLVDPGTLGAYLLRSVGSNDGIWQLNVDIQVGGDWSEGDAKPVKAEAAKSDTKEEAAKA